MTGSNDNTPFWLRPSEEVLQALKIDYQKRADGTIVVPGDIDLSFKRYFRLPNFSSVVVEGHFFCHNNALTSLEGAPRSVGGRFGCSNNLLRSLKGAPESVGEDFYCQNNELTSIEGAPRDVADTFCCSNNKIGNLEGAPLRFKRLQSDFGEFHSWKEIPDGLAPRTKALAAKERDDAIRKSLVLQTPLQASKRLRVTPKK